MSQKTEITANIPPVLCVEMGCRKHFSFEEWRTICPSKPNLTCYQPGFLKVSSIPLKTLESAVFLENATWEEHYYAYRMAYWQRINLPLEHIKSKAGCLFDHHKYQNLIDETQNFKELFELFDNHYEEIATLAKQKLNKESYKPKLKEGILKCALELWLSGYAIRPGLGIRYITNELLEEYADGNNDQKGRFSRYLGALLANSPKSMVKNFPGGYVQKSVFETEQKLWDQQVFSKSDCDNDLINYLYQYAFTEAKSRINKKTIIDHTDETGTLVSRESVEAISHNTWIIHSMIARQFAVLCITSKQLTITEAFGFNEESCVNQFLIRVTDLQRQTRKTILRFFAKWVNRSQYKRIDVGQLFPKTLSASKRTHGKVYNLGMVAHLINVLLDDNSPYFDERNIMDFRCRRATLLCLALAPRPHELLILFRNCIKPDHFGIEYVLFHKTKPVRNNPETQRATYVRNIKAGEDVKKWIAELKAVAPKKKLLFKAESGFGDDLEAYRLFADSTDTGPLTISVLDCWLKRLLRKIWPNEPKPFSIGRMRALSATYEINKRDENAGHRTTNKLDHSNEQIKLPYVLTLSGEDVSQYGKIAPWSATLSDNELEVVAFDEENDDEYEMYDDDFDEEADEWEVSFNLTSEESDDEIKVSSAIGKGSMFQVTPEKIMQMRKLVESTIPIVEAMDTQPRDASPCGYTHNCSAPSILNCTQSPDRCRACDFYKPDEGSEEIHRAQIFSSMVNCLKCMEEESKYKASGFREKLIRKTSDLKVLINQSERGTWVQGFKMDELKAKKLHSDLWKLAKKYIKEYKKLFNELPHTPSGNEAIEYFNTGEIKSWEEK